MELTWGAASRFRLTAHTAGPDVASALDELLSRWQAHLASVPGASADDTAAVVVWPSRDVDGPLPLLHHGLAPRAVIAARPAGRGAGHSTAVPAGSPAPGPAAAAPSSPALRPGVQIRRAGPADIDTVVRLGMATIRFDAHFGTVIERPWSAEALRADASALLAQPGAWTWLAEDDGEPFAMLYAEPPAAAGWIAPVTGVSPVAYLELMYVQPDGRGQGAGQALAGQLHREAAAAGVAVTLLHYEQVNPLSAPFWSRQGYRPLWTSWEAPAGPDTALTGRLCPCPGPILSVTLAGRALTLDLEERRPQHRARDHQQDQAGDDDAGQRPQLRRRARPAAT